ncbi:MarR family winged helix-turn-helix transcriptional regulator [Nocardia takedensis]|uniref:MarR family winged helix-turn-helix transcriptional regulator n=1 Tax=Nocardia takedensis TaxID=259390 RepID=UPI003F768316
MTADPRDLGSQLGSLLGPLRRTVLRRARAAANLPDLPEAQIELLRLLADTDGIAPRQAADSLRMAPSTISNLIRVMAGADLVRREADTSDRRAATLHISQHARALLDRYDDTSAAMLGEAIAGLTAESHDILEKALPTLRELLRVLDT